MPSRVGTTAAVVIDGDYPPSLWDHLIYAYMVENTRVYEIFRRVLEEYAYGERLGVPSDETQRWLRTTEAALLPRQSSVPDLLARELDPPGHPRASAATPTTACSGSTSTTAPTTTARIRIRARRPRTPSSSAMFEELLREVWRAIENVRNQVGANATDVTTIANLARALFDMLRVRRQEHVGNLARDELWHVSTMDWFHLTLSFNTPIVATSRPRRRRQRSASRRSASGSACPRTAARTATSVSPTNMSLDPPRAGARDVQHRHRRAASVPDQRLPGGDAGDHHALVGRDRARREGRPVTVTPQRAGADPADPSPARRPGPAAHEREGEHTSIDPELEGGPMQETQPVP